MNVKPTLEHIKYSGACIPDLWEGTIRYSKNNRPSNRWDAGGAGGVEGDGVAAVTIIIFALDL